MSINCDMGNVLLIKILGLTDLLFCRIPRTKWVFEKKPRTKAKPNHPSRGKLKFGVNVNVNICHEASACILTPISYFRGNNEPVQARSKTFVL